MKALRKKLVAALLFALVLTSELFSTPVFTAVESFGILGGRNVGLRFEARGSATTSYGTLSRVGGVLFQEVAIPAESAEGSVRLEYRADQDDGKRLIISIGDTNVAAEIYDWQLIPTARFADTKYTACMSLFGHPRTQSQYENALFQWAYLVEFHPVFINTLVGINLFFVDTMFVNENIMRVTDNLSIVIDGYNDISIDRDKSTSSSRFIDRIISRHSRERTDELSNTYIFTDYGTEIRYEIQDGTLILTGSPSYLFFQLNHHTQTAIPNERLTLLIRQNIDRVKEINPIIYGTAEQTAQWAAFFRMVKEEYPDVWKDFIAQISGVEIEPHVETPRAFRR